MAAEAIHHNHSTSKHSRSRRLRRSHRHDNCNCSNEEQGSVSSNTKGRDALETAEKPVPGVFTWSQPVLDMQSNGRFQYQFRVTPEACEWAISGSDSGTYPQYLSAASQPTIYHLLDNYLPEPFGLGLNLQNQQQVYDQSNADAGPSVTVTEKGDGDHKAGEDKRPSHGGSKPRRNKSSNDHGNEKKGEKHHHRGHTHHRDHLSHHRRHHHRTKNDDSHESSVEKVNDWFCKYGYAI